MKIAILSRSSYIYSTSRLIEEAKNRGHKVVVVDPLKCNLVMEKNEPNIHVVKHKLERVDAIIPRIGSSITHYGSAVIRQFEMMNVFTALNSNALLRSRDKLRSMQLLSRESIDFPKTFYTNMNSSLEAEEILEFVGGAPIVVKVLEGTQGVGVMLLETKMAAISVIQAMHSLHAKIMVQEYIKEAGGKDLRVLIVNNKVVGAMVREGKDGDFRSNLHRGGTATQAKLSKEERFVALQACKAMGLQVAGVDLIRSDRGPLVLEVNSSPGLEGIEAATGVNIAESIIKFVEHGAKNQSKTKINRING
ncbi:30S ribosomal protein S6--L-glutamate ligase [Weeksellaceae bacterium KMM 9713]|uniref:30S ribosomal protein S6--L-glutamate ligase n=1 Tax=Profundicola chukchiensis TaxID=2961959 RepID=A0A9X4RX20_9FLAO|nr:30S ribosomal protein S6--L-glutamate ligase [Profundicola chukchiensis]MDG4945359.1 30S ribosomal protein S6--L-glutamate ligase [Profundicola chukchiensis]MDG4950432.1 30S ribosomal protein S6--L-glutamate ligase [Profundicola chukchiensis]